MRDLWLSSTDFSVLAAVSRQVANRLLRQFIEGRSKSWRGAVLQVRVRCGQRAAGGKAYTVKVSSIPNDIKGHLNGTKTSIPVKLPLTTLNKGSAEMHWWLHHLDAAFCHPQGSAKRSAAIENLAGTVQLDWKGRKKRMARSTIYRKIADLERQGTIVALSRKQRVDAGKARVIFTKAWDQAVPFDDDTKRKIANDTIQELRGFIAGGATRKIALILTCRFLKAQTAAYGFKPDDPEEFDHICKVPVSLYQNNIHYKKANRHKNDRKASFDAGPVVKRHIRDTYPSSTIVADVHHCNVLVERENGTTATPKLIVFFDIATHRVWVETVFFEGRGGIRNVDMIEAFLAMGMAHSWGLPTLFYCDNGSENLFAGYLDDALKLTLTDLMTNISATGTVKALPYRGRSKPIERWFGQFEQQFLSTCQGYIGDNRMSPQQQVIGKMPAPFPGGIGTFNARVQSFVRAYHSLPQNGQLKGLSPNEVFTNFVEQGWRATVIDPENLLSVFTKPTTRRLRNHTFKADGRVWSCPELDAFLEDQVVVRLPQLGLGFNKLRVETSKGKFIGIAKPEEEFAYHDPRGAKKSAERTKHRNQAIRSLVNSVPHKDVGAEIAALGDSQLPVVPNAPVGIICVSQDDVASPILPTHQPQTSHKHAEEKRRQRAQFTIDNLGKRVLD